MIQRIKLEAVEDKQLPRWVYAMMKANQDPNADPEENDGPKRYLAQLKAKDFYQARQDRLKDMQTATSRYSGLEWKNRPKNKFSTDELDRILPTRRASYVAGKSASVFVVAGLVAFGTAVTLFIGLALCAELKLRNWDAGRDIMFSNPPAYVSRVLGAFEW